ncbi:MAG: hypothetical protein E6K03_00140 [Methanobacteriota archaeon]|nr:MAG: hypothetical protein E6K03_00140 [Euryarchaeota archaeon]
MTFTVIVAVTVASLAGFFHVTAGPRLLTFTEIWSQAFPPAVSYCVTLRIRTPSPDVVQLHG